MKTYGGVKVQLWQIQITFYSELDSIHNIMSHDDACDICFSTTHTHTHTHTCARTSWHCMTYQTYSGLQSAVHAATDAMQKWNTAPIHGKLSKIPFFVERLCQTNKKKDSLNDFWTKKGLYCLYLFIYIFTYLLVVVKALCYKPEGRGFKYSWGHWIFFNWPNPSSRTRPWGLLSL
jgi:hypothetical protein